MELAYLDRIIELDKILRLGNCNDIKSLCDHLNISRSTFFNDIKMMKDMGAPICYSDKKGYCYNTIGRFIVGTR